MTGKEFFVMVGKMRTAQEDYLVDRKTHKLIRAREFEKAVDAVLRMGLEPDEPKPTARVMTLGEYVEQVTECEVHMDGPTADDLIGDEI